MPATRRLVRPRPAEEYDEEPVDPEPQPRRLRRSEPEKEEPRRRPTTRNRNGDESADDDRGLAVAKGWSGYARTKANAPSRFARTYKVKDEESLIMFLEDGPFASFLQHWAEWVARGQKQSYVCLQNNDCPLDKVDPRPQARIRFNILDCSLDVPSLTVFECGQSVTEMLEEYSEDEPLAGRYFVVCMKGPKKSRRTQIRPVKVRDLEEDWDFTALTDKEIAAFDSKLWDDTSLEVDSRADLQRVADAFNE